MNCRHCGTFLGNQFLDLGYAPPSNAYLSSEALQAPVLYFPLRLFVCDQCWLVQTEDYSRAEELFASDYAYYSSVSISWLKHSEKYTAKIVERIGLGKSSFVVEIAANDGYLLKNFVAMGIPCLGIEPTAGTAAEAEKKGVPVVREFFGASLAARLAAEGKRADLIIGNNVFAHVPDINDFTEGMKTLLKADGVITLEFPHLLRLIGEGQFDTVYHEHYSYLSLHACQSIFRRAGLRIWDVEHLPTHGGSLRVYGCHETDPRCSSSAVEKSLHDEVENGLLNVETYRRFQRQTEQAKDALLSFLIEKKKEGCTIAAYGAAAKGNTFLNYAGIRNDLLPYVCDASPYKQGKFLPGSAIPILPPSVLHERKPGYLLILPWNLSEEIMDQCSYIKEWGGRFVVGIPALKVM